MTSTESRQSQAAMLMHAARRSHFFARIEKYQAKIQQEQQLRALQNEKQQVTAMLFIRNPSMSVQDPKFIQLLKEHVTTEQAATSPLHQLESDHEGMRPERKGGKEHKDINEKRHLKHLQLQRMASACPELVILRGISGLNDVSILASAESCPARPTHHLGAHITLKPRAAVNVNITAIASALQIKIKKSDMAAWMLKHAFRCARECLNATKEVLCKQTAYTLKQEFDKLYGPAWHCIVGTSFGSFVTHSVGGFVCFSMDKVSVLLFKTTVEPIEHY